MLVSLPLVVPDALPPPVPGTACLHELAPGLVCVRAFKLAVRMRVCVCACACVCACVCVCSCY